MYFFMSCCWIKKGFKSGEIFSMTSISALSLLVGP